MLGPWFLFIWATDNCDASKSWNVMRAAVPPNHILLAKWVPQIKTNSSALTLVYQFWLAAFIILKPNLICHCRCDFPLATAPSSFQHQVAHAILLSPGTWWFGGVHRCDDHKICCAFEAREGFLWTDGDAMTNDQWPCHVSIRCHVIGIEKQTVSRIVVGLCWFL